MSRIARVLFLALASAAGWVTVVGEVPAQASHHIGVVATSVSEQSDEADAFRQGLGELGYIEGRDISITWWYGHGSYEHASEAVDDLLKRKVDLFVVEGTRAALAAKLATSRIPIVMALVGDPVESGLVQSLAQPGGNVTGLTNQSPDVATKRLQLLHETLPKAARVAVIFNPGVPYSGRYIAELEAAAHAMKLKLTFTSVRTADQIQSALSTLSPARTDVLMPIDDAFMTSQGAVILQMASKARLPMVYAYTPLARKGALLSYAVNHNDLFRRAAGYVDKILKGQLPASLPVQQPTKFELVVNLKTAKALGVAIPESVLLQADEVIR